MEWEPILLNYIILPIIIIFSKNENLRFVIYEGKLYLKEVLQGKTESIREIDVVFIDEGEEAVEVIFRPKLYKIFYMV